MTESKESKTHNPKYQLTEPERVAIGKHLDRNAAAPTAPRVNVRKGKMGQELVLQHPNESVAKGLLMEALGTTSLDFMNGLLSQLANATGSQGQDIDESSLNFMLSVILDIKPRDQLEAMLAAQMAAMHMTIMTFVRRLAHVDNIQQQDSAGALLIKFNRTFAAQMETLKRYRTGGEQKVTVQHVNVGDGGQAIVGNVNQTPQKSPPSEGNTSPPLLTDAKTVPMPLLEEGKQNATVPRRKAK